MSDLLAKFFLILSQPETVAVVFLIGFWFHDRATWGIAIMLAAFSMVLNPALKEFFQMPRPSGAEGYGFPSGHFQGAMCFYGWLFVKLHNNWARLAIAILLAGVGYALVHMGFHFPRDIAGSIVVASIIIGLTYALLQREPFKTKPYLLACVLLGIGILPLAYMLFHSGMQKHSLAGYVAIAAVMLVWWKFFQEKDEKEKV